MTIVGRIPFRLLAAHGVDARAIAVFEHRFGRVLPASVTGPDDVICWTLGLLPWDRVLDVLRPWLVRGVRRADLQENELAQRALGQIERTEFRPACDLAIELDTLIHRLAREREIDNLLPDSADDPRVTDDLRAWIALFNAVGASLAVMAMTPGGTDLTVIRGARNAFIWVASQNLGPTFELTLDRCLADLVTACAQYVDGWAPGAEA